MAASLPLIQPGERRLQAVARLLGAAILGGALLFAIRPLYATIVSGPHVRGVDTRLAGFTLAAGWVAAGLVLAVGLGLLARRRPRVALVVALGIFAASRLAFLAAFDAPLVSDWHAYHLLALGWLRGAPPIADRPMGYPILLAEAFRIGGISTSTAEGLGFIAAMITAVALAALVRRVAGNTAAVVAVVFLTMTPTQLLWTAIAGSEMVYTAALTVVALGAVVLFSDRSRVRVPVLVLGAVGLGLVLGASAYVRATSLAVAPFLALLPVVLRPSRRAVAAGSALLIGTAIALIPATAINLRYLDRLSPATSTYIGWQLDVGTDIASHGRWSAAETQRVDAMVPGYRSGSIPTAYAAGDFSTSRLRAAARRDDAALRVAEARIRTEGVALIPLAVRKFESGWGRSDDAARWMFFGTREADGPLFRAARLVSQAWWVALLALALVAQLRRSGPLPLVVSALLIPVAAAIVILETQGRYHEYVVPLIVAAAAVGLVDLVRRPVRLPRRLVMRQSGTADVG